MSFKLRNRMMTLLDGMTKEEADALREAIGDGGQLEAFLHGWAAAVGFFRAHAPVALWLSAAPKEAGDSFIADVTMAVSLLLHREGHDPRVAPPEELVGKIQALLELEVPPNPRMN